MPTMSAASSDSRHMMSSVSITAGSLHHQRAAPLLVEVVEELVAPGREPRNVDRDRPPGRHHALAVQLEALELDRDRGLVRDLEAQALARRRLDLGGREAVLGDRQRDGPLLGPHRRGEHEEEAERESAHAGRRGLGASEQGSARSARAADGPPGDKVTKIPLVCRRELASMCGGPLAWILAAVFLLLTGYFFYSDLALFVLVGGANQTRGLWRFVFLDFRLVALLVVPLLTMRLFAEERKQGTLELLWTFPVRDGEVLAGKVLAALALYLGMLAATAIGPALLYALHPFAVAPVVAGYASLVLLGVAFVACGAAASTVSENQVVSAMLAYGVLVFAWFATWNEAAIGERIAPALLQLSLFDHFYGFAQGVIDSRDVVYLLAFAALFLFLAHRSLGARAWRGL